MFTTTRGRPRTISSAIRPAESATTTFASAGRPASAPAAAIRSRLRPTGTTVSPRAASRAVTPRPTRPVAPTIHTSSFVLFPFAVPLVSLDSVMSTSLPAPGRTGGTPQ
ncbi:hypothetical protein RKD37_008306 [Streptomyces ambofaciens]